MRFVFSFLMDDCWSQENLKTILIMQNFVEENKLQHGERESPKMRGEKLRFNFIGLSFVSFV